MECGDRFAIALDEGQAHGSRQCSNRTRLPGAARSKKGGACGTAKFREKTSKKADSATRGRIAAMHNLGDRSLVCKQFFALQHRFLHRLE